MAITRLYSCLLFLLLRRPRIATGDLDAQVLALAEGAHERPLWPLRRTRHGQRVPHRALAEHLVVWTFVATIRVFRHTDGKEALGPGFELFVPLHSLPEAERLDSRSRFEQVLADRLRVGDGLRSYQNRTRLRKKIAAGRHRALATRHGRHRPRTGRRGEPGAAEVSALKVVRQAELARLTERAH